MEEVSGSRSLIPANSAFSDNGLSPRRLPRNKTGNFILNPLAATNRHNSNSSFMLREWKGSKTPNTQILKYPDPQTITKLTMGFDRAISFFLLLPLLCLSAEKAKEHYSTFQCIGGTQVFKTESMRQGSITVFPLNNPEFRMCYYKNICMINGSLTYYAKPGNVPQDYLPEGFGGNIHHLSYLRGFTMPVNTSHGPVPANAPFHPTELTFLDSNSWTFNYGHYLHDNVIPTFTAAKIFNLPFTGSQQLMETSCRLFSTLEPAFSDRLVTYNKSMGSYRQACLHRLNTMWPFFYDLPPLYADDYSKSTVCFKKLISGQGSTFGLKSIDLSRAILYREFRDFVLDRLTKKHGFVEPPQEDLILVGLRTVGSAGGSLINDLCSRTKAGLEGLIKQFPSYRVECFVPSDYGFKEEIQMVRRAKVLISVHGTISYLSLFSRDGTIQISVASPKELKENQMLLYITHFHAFYLTWDKLQKLPGLMEHALNLAEAYHHGA